MAALLPQRQAGRNSGLTYPDEPSRIWGQFGLTAARELAYESGHALQWCAGSSAKSNCMPHVNESNQVLSGRSDDEILAWVHSVGGSDATLEEAFWVMKEAFQAQRAAGQSAVIRWEITIPSGEIVTYELEVADGECTLSRGAHSVPRVVLSLELADFLRLVTGCLDGVEAYRSGKLHITGDMTVASALGEWFKELH